MCWLHRQDEQLTTCALCAYDGPRPVLVVMLGLNVSRNLSNRTCDNGHRHIPHLYSLTDKHPWSIKSDYRPRECVEQITLVLKNSLHNNVAKKSGQILLSCVSMRETLTCSNWSASWSTQSVLFVRARTHGCLQTLSRATRQKHNASIRVDDDEEMHTLLGDTDFFNASDGTDSV